MTEFIDRAVGRRYYIESFLGKGGMAEVYKVLDKERSVHLAIKILYPDLAEDKVFLRRFKREAQTLAKLQHPNIVRFYGLERDADSVFILMDYVDGTTLRKEIFQTKGFFSNERILEVFKPICAALYYAHKTGVVHCDVKPANIMIHKNGSILLSDFGIARMTEAATMTLVGAGTPAYMAPEQARGEDPTPQIDIYALGVILFEMLTGGERPFTGESAATTGTTSEKIRWEQINLEPPSPRKYNSAITSELESIVLHCLNKDPSLRFSDAIELFNAINQAMVSARISQVQETVAPTKPVEIVRLPAQPARIQNSPASSLATSKKKQRLLYRYLIMGSFFLLITVFCCVAGIAIFFLFRNNSILLQSNFTNYASLIAKCSATIS